MFRSTFRERHSRWRMGATLTPLVDIVFQLIVFFMVVSQVVSAESEPMLLPSPAESMARQKDQTDRFVIGLFSDEAGELTKIKVNANVVPDLTALVEHVQGYLQRRDPERINVILRGDRRLRYDQVEPVLKALSNASVPSLEIATEFDRTGSSSDSK